ncbi:MAG: WYL domain-containing protein, partial [Clostridia bacterium]
YNIDIVDEAIETSKQILFDYNKIGIDKKMHKTKSHKVSPYQMILHNQHYFLMCYEEYWQNVAFYRLDKITNIQLTDTPLTPIRSLNGYENGINYNELATARPYMFADKPERIVLACPEWFFDELVDWFGADVQIEKSNNDMITVTLTASPKAMEYWALQYGANTEIIEPQHLRDSIKEKITALAEKYN